MKRYALEMQRNPDGDVCGVMAESKSGTWVRHDELGSAPETPPPGSQMTTKERGSMGDVFVVLTIIGVVALLVYAFVVAVLGRHPQW